MRKNENDPLHLLQTMKWKVNSLNEYDFRVVGAEHTTRPSQLHCDHHCTYIIQCVNPFTDEVELEFCPLQAERFAGALLDAIELSHKSA
ncbi:hypothetical protein [Alicyclobacillus fastidiosus]|uniref:Uncharacterized protein n=1 Tax=Alicyclobacillus fastidiosus TaxID=392011 RepID=A0ABV5AB17_9BACL|nr:hypothetical protein [Alicyclobacillus fastidiosus]WEH11840.1 hypothetical protein PYS47_11825 [Alicyclobacillus fastidiosus]